jgi:hypothetical protein
MRAFGPLCRDFFVPWERLAIVRENRLLGPIAKLQFGNPVSGTLRISAHTADRLARVAGKRWPEAGPFPEEKRVAHVRRLLAQWAVATLFFTVVPLAVAPSGSRPPILVAILFPALIFGAAFVVRFLFERSWDQDRHLLRRRLLEGCRLARCSKSAAIWGTPVIKSMCSSRQPVTHCSCQGLACAPNESPRCRVTGAHMSLRRNLAWQSRPRISERLEIHTRL